MKPEVTLRGALSTQICVHKEWTEKEILEFVNRENPCGTENGWQIRREGDKALNGDPERQPCDSRKDFTHIMLDA
jgi:hypothetical protein